MRAFLVLFLALPAAALPADPATDDFERTILGGNWTAYRQSSAEVIGGHDLCLMTPTALMNVGWTALVFPVDSFSEGTVVSGVAPGIVAAGVFVRRRTGDDARYTFSYDPAAHEWVLAYDGPTMRRLAAVAGAAPQGNSVIRLDARGTSPVELFGAVDGAVIVYATDSAADAITTPGPMGLSASLSTTVSNSAPPIFAAWRGGTSRTVPPLPPDAGTPVVDAGSVKPDAGTADAGAPITDAGTLDAGTTTTPPIFGDFEPQPSWGCDCQAGPGALGLALLALLRRRVRTSALRPRASRSAQGVRGAPPRALTARARAASRTARAPTRR